jgi:hypothetical protein
MEVQPVQVEARYVDEENRYAVSDEAEDGSPQVHSHGLQMASIAVQLTLHELFYRLKVDISRAGSVLKVFLCKAAFAPRRWLTSVPRTVQLKLHELRCTSLHLPDPQGLGSDGDARRVVYCPAAVKSFNAAQVWPTPSDSQCSGDDVMPRL